MKAKIAVGVFGALGRMGHEILLQIGRRENFRLAAAIDQTPGQNGGVPVKTLDDLETAPDVVIDFSSPRGTEEVTRWCRGHKVPLVSGTTGLAPAQEKLLASSSKVIPVFSSPNMSLGINGMVKAVEAYLGSFEGGEVSVMEIHHKHKKDKPSGTAKLLMKSLEKFSRRGMILSEPVSLRGGDVFGIHKVYFFSEGEWVCFEHHATGREVFAIGALKAAAWLVKRKPGLYSMADYFESREGR